MFYETCRFFVPKITDFTGFDFYRCTSRSMKPVGFAGCFTGLNSNVRVRIQNLYAAFEFLQVRLNYIAYCNTSRNFKPRVPVGYQQP